jgi:outer membrane protein OmpA-like peptidoglycan-associated protein/uncharacterized protein YegL
MLRAVTILFFLFFINAGVFSQASNVVANTNIETVSVDKQAFENAVNSNTIENYKKFIYKYPKSKWRLAAEDSLLAIGSRKNDVSVLSYCVDNFRDNKRLIALKAYHDVFTNDGEKQSLDLFYKKYNHSIFRETKANDYKKVKLGDELSLENSYKPSEFSKYDAYIRLAAPQEKAFVALQRMISANISKKEWKKAIEKVEIYKPYFGQNNKKINNLVALLSSKQDKPIKIYSAGNLVNTTGGGEYLPVLSADEKFMYYCGRDRPDNIGGEDIFVSKKVNGGWTKGQLLSNLSSHETNDSPLSISSDGSMLLIFKSGKLNYAERTDSGWSKPKEFPSQINAGSWQADAMITSNGRGLIYSSTKKGGENFFNNRQNYHGDMLYPSDIYISLMNEKDEWGEPINLGNTINTRYCDRMPFLHPDMKTLYFSSDGHGGLGKMDIFKSTRLADSCWNCWSEPVNLGIAINTNESDADFKITALGEKAFFSYEKVTYFENSIMFLLDVSGSMSGPKLESLKQATISAGRKAIRNNSEVAILTFGGDCANPISDIFPFSKNADSLSLFAKKLKIRDGTPLFEAYLFACEYIKKYANSKNSNNTITLMTDGNSYNCIGLDELLKTITDRGEIYKTNTIAYNVSENTTAYKEIKQISEFTKGTFHPLNNFEELSESFEGSINEIFNVNSASYNKDIYWINLPHYLRPEKVNTLTGRLVDKHNRPVSAKISLEDLETGKIVGQTKSDPTDGSFFIVLPSGKIYGYYIDEDEYFPVSNNVDLQNNKEIIKVNKDLKAVKFNQIMNEGTIIPLNNIFFQFAKFSLLPYSISELKRVASIIRKSGFSVEIIGHTDNVGDDDSNQVLSENRAFSVRDFLVLEGCDVEKLQTRGYGEKRPAFSNINESGRAKNRRVELRFTK